jgi:hypothetical protein
MKQQTNTTVQDGEDVRKFEVGRRLRFDGFSKDESEEAAKDSDLKPGDTLVILPKNGCGIGIDVQRERDGHLDMVFPEEVALLPRLATPR